MRDGGAEIPARRRKEVDAELKALGYKSTTTLSIKSSVPGAYVKIDGVVVGRTPIEKPVAVSSGTHKIVFVSDGNITEKTVQIAAGTHETVEIDVKPAPSAPMSEPGKGAPPASPPPPGTLERAPERPASAAQKGHERPSLLPWVVTGVFAAGTAATGVLLAVASSDYDSKRSEYPVTRESLEEAHDKGVNLLVATTVLGAATLVAGGLATWSTFFRRSQSKADTTVGIAIGPTGISFAGRVP